MTEPIVSPPPPAPLAIRRARLMAGLTQAQAARLVYRTARTWIGWETGEHPMDFQLYEIFLTKSARVSRLQYPRGTREPKRS